MVYFKALMVMKQPLELSTRRRLAGFARTLRDNGFKVGLAETRDALILLASPAAEKPSRLKPAFRALFCATHSDWDKFDDIFDAYWLGRGMRQMRLGLRCCKSRAGPAASASSRQCNRARSASPITCSVAKAEKAQQLTRPRAARRRFARRQSRQRGHAPHRRSG